LHYVISNMNHEIFYIDQIKKTRGMNLITLKQNKDAFFEILKNIE
jgi:hypothetical protein